jgi:hypothetical protein
VVRHRKLVAIVCVAAVLLVAITPAGWGLLCGVLVPIDPLFAFVASEPAVLAAHADPAPSPVLDPLDSRGPPVL